MLLHASSGLMSKIGTCEYSHERRTMNPNSKKFRGEIKILQVSEIKSESKN